MATNWQLTGTNQLIATVRQAAAAQEDIAFSVNGMEPASILGGYVQVLATGGGSSTVDVKIGATSCLKAAQATNVAGSFALDLTATAANLNIDADEQVTVSVANGGGGNPQVQVTLFISQAAPATLA